MATALRGHANSIETPPPCPPKAVGMAPTFWPIADPDERLARLLNANRFGGFTHADRPRDSPRRAAHAEASRPRSRSGTVAHRDPGSPKSPSRSSQTNAAAARVSPTSAASKQAAVTRRTGQRPSRPSRLAHPHARVTAPATKPAADTVNA